MARAEEPKGKPEHGVEVPPYKTIPPDAGWLTCPENKGKYTGENAPWRR